MIISTIQEAIKNSMKRASARKYIHSEKGKKTSLRAVKKWQSKPENIIKIKKYHNSYLKIYNNIPWKKTRLSVYWRDNTKRWRKNNPDKIKLGWIQYYNKIGISCNMTGNQYQWALKSWSYAVRERDGACVNCGTTKNLHAHHILSKKDYPELSLMINNGVTNCFDCHKETDSFGGR